MKLIAPTCHRILAGLLFLSFLGVAECPVRAQTDTPFAVEYYYKVKWGHVDEFLDLYKRNHYPILVKLKNLGRIVDMSAASPFYHSGEDTRWDFRFTIVWKNATVAHEDFDTSQIVQELYPDQEKFKQEEQRRFQLLEQHLDVPVVELDLAAWPGGA
ncbi:MAG: hypothetical protein ACE5JX_19890 [Acidobacteriota bacterium]